MIGDYFTTGDIKDNKQLVNFIRQKTERHPYRSKVKGVAGFENVYCKQTVIDILKNNIESCRPNVTKFIPVWQSHIDYLNSKGK